MKTLWNSLNNHIVLSKPKEKCFHCMYFLEQRIINNYILLRHEWNRFMGFDLFVSFYFCNEMERDKLSMHDLELGEEKSSISLCTYKF